MAISLNRAGYRYALSLIERGQIDQDSPWSWSADDENKILGDPPKWNRYRRWFLARDTDADEQTKSAWKYPFGKNGKVYRSALRAIRVRAAQQGAKDVYDAAGRLLDMVREKAGENPSALGAESIGSGVSIDVPDNGGPAILRLDGVIGREITAAAVREAMARAKGLPLVMKIKSPGGEVDEALEIFDMLREHDAPVAARIGSHAGSAATILVMAAERISIAPHATMLIHQPWTVAAGDADTLEKRVNDLRVYEETFARIYASRTGMDEESARDLMRMDALIPADEAVRLGLADVIEERMQTADSQPDAVMGNAEDGKMQQDSKDKVMASDADNRADDAGAQPNGADVIDLEKVRAEERRKALAEAAKARRICVALGLDPERVMDVMASKGVSLERAIFLLGEEKAQNDDAGVSGIMSHAPMTTGAADGPRIDYDAYMSKWRK